jgi:hypothetical protein
LIPSKGDGGIVAAVDALYQPWPSDFARAQRQRVAERSLAISALRGIGRLRRSEGDVQRASPLGIVEEPDRNRTRTFDRLVRDDASGVVVFLILD